MKIEPEHVFERTKYLATLHADAMGHEKAIFMYTINKCA